MAGGPGPGPPAAALRRRKAEEGKRRREEAATQEEAARAAAGAAKRAHVESYLASLAPEERAEFERLAVATASGLYRDQTRGSGPLAEASRRLVIEDAVLRALPMG